MDTKAQCAASVLLMCCSCAAHVVLMSCLCVANVLLMGRIIDNEAKLKLQSDIDRFEV